MFGDYYTNTLVSGSPDHDDGGQPDRVLPPAEPGKGLGASLVLILSVLLMALMAYYLMSTQRASREATVSGAAAPAAGVLATITWLYVAWSLVPVLIAVQFSFNDGRSRTTWQGASFRWYWGDDFALGGARPDAAAGAHEQPASSGCSPCSSPPRSGVALALGLTRWRGRTSKASNGLMLLPLATPEIVHGQRAVPGVHEPLHARSRWAGPRR